MRNHLYKVSIVFLAICYMVSLSGCSSKEDRANKLIKERMSKTLYDFNSYDPIETIVSEAKATMYNDTACWNDGSLLAASMKLGLKYAEDMKDAKDYMDIWGPPSYYSSSYSDNKYYKYKNEYEDAVNSFKSTHEVCKIIVESLRNKITDLDENNIIGWEIMHKFRCKTKGGYSTIGNYRFVMDKGFNSILIVEDIDDEDDQFIRSAMETVLTDYWDK